MIHEKQCRDRKASRRAGRRAGSSIVLRARALRLFALVLSLLAGAACESGGTATTGGGSGGSGTGGSGGSYGPGVSQKIDPNGGQITFEGVVLDIPPGAVDDEQTITIEESYEAPPDGVTPLSPIYHFGPDGLQFKLPVTVTIPYEGGADDAVIYWSDGNGGFDQSGMIGVVAAGAVTTLEMHFSSGFVSKLSQWREMPCDNTDAARQLRASCKMKPGDICLDNMPSFPIQYVFVLMQENRSFDNYFGRFQAYLKKKYSDARTQPGGLEVPATPYELLDPAAQAQEDAKTDLCSYDPKKDAPYNPTKAAVSPQGACDKHYWRHAKGNGEQCVSDTCHEWWCSHLQVDSGRMDGFFQGNDSYWEGGAPNVGYPPSPVPSDWYDQTKHPNAPTDGSLLRGDRAMVYYDETDIPFYYWLADAFGLADHYHSSVIGPTFVNRDYLYGATSRGLTSNASNNYGDSAITGSPFIYAGDQTANPPVITYKKNLISTTSLNTIYDDCDIRDVGYTQWVRNRYSNLVAVAKYGAWYGGTSVLADSHKYTYDKQSFGGNGFETYVQEENARLVKAIKKGADPATIGPQGKVLPVNFIDPDPVENVNGEDEHPPSTPQMGQRLTYDIVRVLTSNPEVWKRSVLFITWDEHGGFYDHVEPPPACPPDNIAPVYTGAYGGGPKTSFSDGKSAPRQGSTAIDASDSLYTAGFDQYGVRVPLLVISPWVKHQSVSHYTYDHTSIVRFIEARFGMPAITSRDANADPMFDFFDFSQAAQKLKGTVPAPKECITCNGKWGTESLPSGPTYTDAAGLGTNKSPAAVRYRGTANAACLGLFPPAPCGAYTSCDLGVTVYGGYDWSRGTGPKGQVQCGGGGGCCEAQPCPLDWKWCGSDCSCEMAYQCPIGDFSLGGCECCFQFDFLDPLTCIICDSKENVFDTYCPGG